jgi:peptidyl-prolyl cis-trans isomerase B (cyclophilin B)
MRQEPAVLVHCPKEYQVSPTNARDKARARNSRAAYDSRQALRAQEVRRNKQVLVVVLLMVALVATFVGATFALKTDDKSVPGSQAAPTAPAAPAAPAKPVVAGCRPAPATPGKRTATLPDKATAAGKTFIATVTTNCGVITMELDGTKAPQTVASFAGLAKSGYWADSPCHRLTTTSIFVLQCGDPTGTGSGDPGYGYGVENAPADFNFAPGTLAMARTKDPKSNGGQFFIVYKATKLEDPIGYSVFGKVTSGMDIVQKIAAAGVNPSDGTAPMQPISMLTVNVTEKKA